LNRKGRQKTKKVLLIRLRRIGDVVMTTPAVALLKQHRPSVSLTYLIEEPCRRLVEGNPHIDRIISVPRKQKFRDFAALIRMVRRERYDALIDFHGGPRASWITFFSGAKRKIGYAIKHKGFLYDVRVPRSGGNGFVHSVQNHANLVRALGIEFDDAAVPPLWLPEAKGEETRRVREILKKASAGEKKYIVIHIGAGNQFRDWGTENIVELIGRLARATEFKIVLVGGEGDKKNEEKILQKIATALADVPSKKILSLVDQLNLIEIKALIAEAALFVGPDSGPMHIAASTMTPIVAYFGPTLPAHFAPWRPDTEMRGRTAILQKDLACRPCKQRECLTADVRCLRMISAEEVFSACLPFLGSGLNI